MPAELGDPLSEREIDVVRLVAQGAANREIAQTLSISPNTVKVHLRNVYTKLGVTSRTEALRAAMGQGLVPLPGQDTTGHDPGDEPGDGPGHDPGHVPGHDPGHDPGHEPGHDPAFELAAGAPSPAAGAALLEPGRPAGDESGPSPNGWRRFSRTSLAVVGGLLALTALGLGVLAAFRLRLPASAEPSGAEVFTETQIGDSNWFISRALPAPRRAMALVALGLDLYQIGGMADGRIDGAVTSFDSRLGQWQPRAAKPTPVAEVSAAVLFGEIYVPGGRGVDDRPTATVEAYSPANDAWRAVAGLPRPVQGGLALADGSFLYLFGGFDGQVYRADSYLFDPTTDSWRPLPPMARARAHAVGGVIGGRLYVVGGQDESGALADCAAFDPAEARWRDCPPMLQDRTHGGAAVLFNRLYVFGGLDQAAESFSEFYDPNSGTWQVVNMPPSLDGGAWQEMGVANVERRIYVVGGRRPAGPAADTLVYIPFPHESFLPNAASENR